MTRAGIDTPEVAAQRPARELHDLPRELDSGGAGADDHERQPHASQLRIAARAQPSRTRRRSARATPVRRQSSSFPARDARTRGDRDRLLAPGGRGSRCRTALRCTAPSAFTVSRRASRSIALHARPDSRSRCAGAARCPGWAARCRPRRGCRRRRHARLRSGDASCPRWPHFGVGAPQRVRAIAAEPARRSARRCRRRVGRCATSSTGRPRPAG